MLLSAGFQLVYRGLKVSTKDESLFLKAEKFSSKLLLSLTHLGLDLTGLSQPKFFCDLWQKGHEAELQQPVQVLSQSL